MAVSLDQRAFLTSLVIGWNRQDDENAQRLTAPGVRDAIYRVPSADRWTNEGQAPPDMGVAGRYYSWDSLAGTYQRRYAALMGQDQPQVRLPGTGSAPGSSTDPNLSAPERALASVREFFQELGTAAKVGLAAGAALLIFVTFRKAS